MLTLEDIPLRIQISFSYLEEACPRRGKIKFIDTPKKICPLKACPQGLGDNYQTTCRHYSLP